MSNRNGLVCTLGVLLVLALVFIGYRARTFNYCASTGDRPAPRIVTGSESCGPNEEPLEWRRLGWYSRIKLTGRTAAKALGAN
jgi:hypothetical protein